MKHLLWEVEDVHDDEMLRRESFPHALALKSLCCPCWGASVGVSSTTPDSPAISGSVSSITQEKRRKRKGLNKNRINSVSQLCPHIMICNFLVHIFILHMKIYNIKWFR